MAIGFKKSVYMINDKQFKMYVTESILYEYMIYNHLVNYNHIQI